MAQHELFGVFGYGSLVNLNTLKADIVTRKCNLLHWRREWKHIIKYQSYGQVCGLTATSDANNSIDGLLQLCTEDELQKLDKREQGYHRILIDVNDILCDDLPALEGLFIYTSDRQYYGDGSQAYPIWYSYLETVILGYWQVFGEDGVNKFITSTHGWSTPILDDRNEKIYPRARVLSYEEIDLCELLIGRIPILAKINHLNLLKTKRPDN